MRVVQHLGMSQEDTWIVGNEMEEAYINLHKNGIAHSVEVWQNGEIVGGLYGLIIGKVFFGESMFFTVSNASKYGFIWLVNHLIDIGIELIDCQVETEHLASLGAKSIPRNDFLELLRELV
jgi:leucyl/phenylalanyl-tRNA--protein transferase